MESFSLQDLIEFLSKFHKLFDVVRIIEPVKKQVIHYDDVGASSDGSICYDFWQTGTQCSNCVSARAMSENDTFIKIEYNDARLFMIMASPIKLGNDEYVVEMLKDITATGVINAFKSADINNILLELNEKIITDELTGVYNRRYINERLPADIYHAMLQHEKLSVVMLDIDCFKEINDNYGHMAGDTVIKELCQTMQSKIRKGHDWIARYGGEEFLIVLTGVDQRVAYKVSEKIRHALANKKIKYRNHIIRVTVSIGTYTVEPGVTDLNDVLHIADKNLYLAKKQGKNRIVSS